MSVLRAAVLAAAVLSPGVFAPARAEVLALDDAFERVLSDHPDLAAWQPQRARLEAERAQAALRPPLELGVDAENVLGSGAAAALRGAELTLSLASVLEDPRKRAARLAVADRQLEALALTREARRLDLLAEVARRYLAALAARAEAEIAGRALAQHERLLAAARERVARGGAAPSLALSAAAATARARAELAAGERARRAARRQLAALWGEPLAEFELATIALAAPPVPDLAQLRALLARTPELRRFADEARVREARLQLAASAGGRDVRWQAGLRRLEASDDFALVAGLSIPLGSAGRAEPGVRAAQAELDALAFERAGVERALAATVVEAWEQLDAAVAQADDIERALLPALAEAAQAAERAWRHGAGGFLDWQQLLLDGIAAERACLHARVRARRALIELQRLTGETFAATEESR